MLILLQNENRWKKQLSVYVVLSVLMPMKLLPKKVFASQQLMEAVAVLNMP
jgi:hypothetical protein